MDIYSTRAQLKMLEQIPQDTFFLMDMTCHDAGTVEDDKAIYDFRKGTRPMAPVVHPGTGGVLMGRDGYQTREIGFATIAPERVIEVEQLKGRMFGEDILGALTPEQREIRMLTKDLKEMRQAIQRRRAYMVRQVITTGKLELFRYTNEGRDKETTLLADYDFTNNFTPDTPWDQAGAKIESDMQEMYDIIQEASGDVEWMIMSTDVANAMRENSDYLKHLDIRNMDVGNLTSQYRGQGVRFLGYNIDNVAMYSYAGTFVDDDGVTKRILPDGTLIMGAKNLLDMYHGPVTQVEETGLNARHKTYIKKEVPLRHGSIDSNAIMNRLTSCPTFVPRNVDAWVVAHVL